MGKSMKPLWHLWENLWQMRQIHENTMELMEHLEHLRKIHGLGDIFQWEKSEMDQSEMFFWCAFRVFPQQRKLGVFSHSKGFTREEVTCPPSSKSTRLDS
jgi:hypothetical protein